MIVGKRVRFRSIEEEDLPLLASWMNDPQISHLVCGFSFPVSLAGQREWYRRTLGDQSTQRWMVETLEGEPIGLTGLWGIDFHNRHAMAALKLGSPSNRGKGYGTDVVMTLMSYAFYQVGLNRLWAEILSFNLGSYGVFVRKCGWKVEGVSRQHVFRDGQFVDQLHVGILKSEFDSLPTSSAYIPRAEVNAVAVRDSEMALGAATPRGNVA